MDLTEGVGESSSPPRSFGSFSNHDLRNNVYNRFIESGYDEAVSNPELFREHLDSHFNRLPASYGLDVNMDKVEDVLLHQKLLAMAKDPERRPVYHIRFLEKLCTKTEGNGEQQLITMTPIPRLACDIDDGVVPSQKRIKDCTIDFEPCSKLEDLNLDVRKSSKDMEERYHLEDVSRRQEVSHVPIHEFIFCTVDKPKLLSQLSALLSDIGLNIREAHVFSTTDCYSLDVFVVDGWPTEETDGLYKATEEAIARSEGSWSGSSHSHSSIDKASAAGAKPGDWEIDRRLLKIGERIASGSCGDLYCGVYFGQDVAIKIFRSEQLNDTQEEEFAQEVAILREVQHRNVVRFIGACTTSPHLCIVTEFMPGGSLYDYLHKNHNILELHQVLKFVIDVCKGMEYLHQKNIIHRDLKTANLLMDTQNVVKVADFGVARFQNQGGVMTAETGTYRWMAPEVINHLPYDQKADVFSFAIVLWELVTAKVPYDSMTPLQAALGVRQGLRPDLPQNAHPKLLDLMQRCWETVPDKRPSFSEITVELETLLQESQESTEEDNRN
ncbi:SERINE/THREONINE-PROTEIN KINASE TNNI3K-RELATED [Salix purpurea]|uniref:non-specific serine/threonine protein kinase n=1 Tax=Salix purpurea TaxID=77065 RepID=A0A9Q0PC20_SALPP|nr:SERINE/THREONINE-PROTEIN KINASE TNNI3K-RELATED [Salix purpurea]